MPQYTTKETFLDALDSLNQAIEQNKDAVFFRALLESCASMSADELMGVAVYQSDPQSPHDFYTVRMHDGQVEFVGHDQEMTQTDWLVSEDYLSDLARNCQKYIDHPEKLSLNWLAERVVATTG